MTLYYIDPGDNEFSYCIKAKVNPFDWEGHDEESAIDCYYDANSDDVESSIDFEFWVISVEKWNEIVHPKWHIQDSKLILNEVEKECKKFKVSWRVIKEYKIKEV